MGTAHGNWQDFISKRLLANPERFEFFQAAYLLEQLVSARPGSRVEFKVVPDLVFPSQEIVAVTYHEVAGQPTWSCETTVLGLVGALGVLPPHYTEQVLTQVRYKQTQLRDFISWFEQRSLELLYEVWRKYRIHALVQMPDCQDRFTKILRYLGGTKNITSQQLTVWVGRSRIDTNHHQHTHEINNKRLANANNQTQPIKLPIPEAVLAYYTGLFNRSVRSVETLKNLLQSYCQVPVAVKELVGSWLTLEPENHSCLPSQAKPKGCSNALGQSAALGARCWSIQSQFEIQLGPLSRKQYEDLLPGQANFQALHYLIKIYLQAEFSIRIRLILAANAFIPGRLGTSNTYLGWTAWLSQQEIINHKTDLVVRGD